MKIPDMTTWGTFKPKGLPPIGVTRTTPAGTGATSYGAGAVAGSPVSLKPHPGPTPVGPPDLEPDTKSNARKA